MEHFETSVQQMLTSAGFLGGIVTFLALMLEHTTLAAALAGFAVLMVAGVLYMLYSLESDVETQFEAIETRIDAGFEETISSLDDADPDAYPARTDGGGWEPVKGLHVDKEEISGVPSLAGAAAGGALAAPFGPQAAVAGAVLGALLGGGKEYSDLKDQHQTKLRETAWQALSQKAYLTRLDADLAQITDVEDRDEKYWEFRFVDKSGPRHRVRISKQSGDVFYNRSRFGEGIEDSGPSF